MTRVRAEGIPQLGDRVRALIAQRGISVPELSRRTGGGKGGISPSYLRRIMSNEVTNPTIDFVVRIARGLGVTVSELVGDRADQERIERSPQALAKTLGDTADELIGDLLAGAGEAGEFHRSAAAEVVKELLARRVPRLADDFKTIAARPPGGVELSVYPLVEDYLVRLLRKLPPGTIALAVVRLGDPEAWARGTAKEEWDGFNRILCARARTHSLRYYRLFCLQQGHPGAEAVEDELRTQVDSGVRVKVWHPKSPEDGPPDMLLLWTPRAGHREVPGKPDHCDRAGELRLISELIEGKRLGYRPEYAMTFTVRGGVSYEGMTLHEPESAETKQLEGDFLRYWGQVDDWGPDGRSGGRGWAEAGAADSGDAMGGATDDEEGMTRPVSS